VYRTDAVEITEIVFDPFEGFHMREDLPNVPKPSVDLQVKVTDDNLLNMSLKDAVQKLKVRMMNRALSSARHNQKKAAQILGLTYHQFRGLYRTFKDDIK